MNVTEGLILRKDDLRKLQMKSDKRIIWYATLFIYHTANSADFSIFAS